MERFRIARLSAGHQGRLYRAKDLSGRVPLFRGEARDGESKKQGGAAWQGCQASVPEGESLERKKAARMIADSPHSFGK